MKTLVGMLCLSLAGCGQPRETARPAPPLAPPVAKPPGDPEGEIRSRLAIVTAMLDRKDLTREDQAQVFALRKELALVVWSGRESVLAALRIAPELLEKPTAMESLELALLQKPDAGGFVSELRDGRRVTRRERDVFFLDSRTSEEIARRVLEEKDGRLRLLALIVLRTHAGSLTWKDDPHLGPATLENLITTWSGLGSHQGRMGQSSRGLLLSVVGPYAESDGRVRTFLEEIIHDTRHDTALRSTALGEYRRGPVTPARLAMAETLFSRERDAQLRRDAIDLVSVGFMDEAEKGVESKAFDLLNKVAREDPAGDVRIAAGRAILEFKHRGAVAATAKLLEAEKDAAVRAGILAGFRWGSIFKEDREEIHGAQDLAAKQFLNDPDEGVQRSAIRAYLDLLWSTLWVHDESGSALDPRALESIQEMVGTIQKKALSRETRTFIKEKLEKDFEKRIPELAGSGDYAELKRSLEK